MTKCLIKYDDKISWDIKHNFEEIITLNNILDNKHIFDISIFLSAYDNIVSITVKEHVCTKLDTNQILTTRLTHINELMVAYAGEIELLKIINTFPISYVKFNTNRILTTCYWMRMDNFDVDVELLKKFILENEITKMQYSSSCIDFDYNQKICDLFNMKQINEIDICGPNSFNRRLNKHDCAFLLSNPNLNELLESLKQQSNSTIKLIFYSADYELGDTGIEDDIKKAFSTTNAVTHITFDFDFLDFFDFSLEETPKKLMQYFLDGENKSVTDLSFTIYKLDTKTYNLIIKYVSQNPNIQKIHTAKLSAQDGLYLNYSNKYY